MFVAGERGMQGSLFGVLEPAIDARLAGMQRIELDARSWVDHLPGWLEGADTVFDELVARLPFRQRRAVPMYDSLVDEPRLSAWWRLADGEPEPIPILGRIRAALGDRYGVDFDSIGFNLYRDGNDSVAWHGDRHRHTVIDPIVAIVSVGERRPLRLRPRPGREGEPPRSAGTAHAGESRAWSLGSGDLFVMGGACQHDWEHTVPKVRSAGQRMSITFRYGTSTPDRLRRRAPR